MRYAMCVMVPSIMIFLDTWCPLLRCGCDSNGRLQMQRSAQALPPVITNLGTGALLGPFPIPVALHFQSRQVRGEVRGWVSYRGVERFVVDGPCVHISELSRFREVVARLEGGGRIALGSEDTVWSFIFPNALYMADTVHDTFGALQVACESAPWWQVFWSHLTALSSFLNDNGLRMRFVATCCTGNHSRHASLFSSWGGQICNWKWHLLERVFGTGGSALAS